MTSKKDREIALVEAVRRRMSGIPNGSLTPHEAPDVLLKHPGGLLGLEVTNLYPRQNVSAIRVQAQESERRDVVDRATALAAAKGLPPLLVSVGFIGSSVLRKSGRDALARSIAALVETHQPPEYGTVILDDCGTQRDQLPEEVYSVRVFRPPGITRHSWSANEAAVAAEDFSTVIQEVIDKKASALTRYLTSCDACHLVIVSGLESTTPTYEASDATLGHCYKSPFARTFYLEAFGERIFELTTTGAESNGIA